MTTWVHKPIPDDEGGRPMFKGLMELTNDKGECLGSISWFYESGPFYAHAMDAKDTSLLRRIGPHDTLDGAKFSVDAAITGKKDLSGRAAYRRLP